MEHFEVFLEEAHRRNIQVIADLLVNHTSDQHYWFQEARRSPDSHWYNYYVGSNAPDRYKDACIIFIDTEKSNWTLDSVANKYYWHRFFSHQPDLNYDNAEVREDHVETKSVLGSRVGGIMAQLAGDLDYCVFENIDEAADKLVTLLTDKEYAAELGRIGHDCVHRSFLCSRLERDELAFLKSLSRP